VDATRRAQADPIPDTVRCGRFRPVRRGRVAVRRTATGRGCVARPAARLRSRWMTARLAL